jgi:hypothetical protein
MRAKEIPSIVTCRRVTGIPKREKRRDGTTEAGKARGREPQIAMTAFWMKMAMPRAETTRESLPEGYTGL